MRRTPSLRLSVCVHFLRLKVILYLDTRLTTDTTYTLLIDKHTQHPHRWADVWSVLEVLTLSHRCNPSVRLRQDVNKAFKSAPQNDWAVSQAKREFVQQTSNNNVTDVSEVCLRFVSPQSGRLTHSGSVPVGPPSVKFSSSRVCCLFLQKSSSQTRLLELWPQEIVW